MEVRKTLQAWEQEYGIYIVDLDGFDTRDSQLYLRGFTRAEFETGLAFCTIVRRHDAAGDNTTTFTASVGETAAATSITGAKPAAPDRVASPAAKSATSAPAKRAASAPTDRAAADSPASDALRRVMRPLAVRWQGRLFRRLVVLFTLPVLATVLIDVLYGALSRFVRIRWYWPALVLATDALIVLLAPLAPLISGPLYLWYIVVGALVHVVGHGMAIIWQATPWGHGAPTPALGTGPFLGTVQIAGNAVPLYFHLGTAITSSLVWGSVVSSLQHFWVSRHRRM